MRTACGRQCFAAAPRALFWRRYHRKNGWRRIEPPGEAMAKKTIEDACENVAEVATLALDTALFAPGDRVCVAVSGGADSTALLRTLLAQREANWGLF